MSEGISGFSDAVKFWKHSIVESDETKTTAAIVRPGVNVGYKENDLLKAIDKGNKAMRQIGLEFSLHEDTHRTLVKVIDKQTKEVIREIPSEKYIDMVASFMKDAGLILDKSV